MVPKEGIEPPSTGMISLLVFAVKLFGRLVVEAGLEPTEHAKRVSRPELWKLAPHTGLEPVTQSFRETCSAN